MIILIMLVLGLADPHLPGLLGGCPGCSAFASRRMSGEEQAPGHTPHHLNPGGPGSKVWDAGVWKLPAGTYCCGK